MRRVRLLQSMAVSPRLLNLYGQNRWESAGKSSFQGSTFFVGVTIARPNAP